MLKSIILALQGLFNIVSKFMDNLRRSEEQAQGARKGELESRDKQDEVRKDADKVWDRPDDGRIDTSGRLRRSDTKRKSESDD